MENLEQILDAVIVLGLGKVRFEARKQNDTPNTVRAVFCFVAKGKGEITVERIYSQAHIIQTAPDTLKRFLEQDLEPIYNKFNA